MISFEKSEAVIRTQNVMEQVADSDRTLVCRYLRQVVADVVIERKLARLGEQQDAGGCELLGDRADVEHGFGRDRHAVVEVCPAVTSFENGSCPASDSHRTTRTVSPIPLGQEPVDLLRFVAGMLQTEVVIERKRR